MINRSSPTKFDAILNLVGNTKHFSVSPEDEFKWLEDTDDGKPSEEAIQTKLVSMISEWDAQAYARNRASAYPSVGDQLDMMYKDTKNSTTTHADAVEAVKTKWPKDNSGPVE